MKTADKLVHLLGLLMSQGDDSNVFNMNAGRVFFTVAGNEGISQTEIAKKLDLVVSTVSRTVRSLADEKSSRHGLGLLRQRAAEDNWRSVEISLTGKGHTLMKQVELILDAQSNGRTSGRTGGNKDGNDDAQ